MARRDTKKLISAMTKKVEEESDQPSDKEEQELNSEEEEKLMKEKIETLDRDIAELDESAQKRIRNLEFAADRFLWFPDPDSTEKVRCRCCIKKQFHSMADALEHLKSRGHKHQMRRYVIENCKDKDKIEDIKKEKKIRMQRWIDKKTAKAAAKKQEKLKNLSEEEIEKRKKKFQEKKARRLARKQAQ